MLTARERDCLEYLEPRMEANAAMIGDVIAPEIPNARNRTRYGEVVAESLRWHEPSLVTWILELHAYRITKAGRAALADQTNCKTCGGRGYVVEDSDYRPVAVECLDCEGTSCSPAVSDCPAPVDNPPLPPSPGRGDVVS